MNNLNSNLMHGDLTHAIIGAGMDVHNTLGPGWDEMDYHLAMLNALADRGLKVESHLRGSLMHRAQCVDRFELDIIVEGKVILELKHIRTNFAPEHYAQLINYLKFWNKDLGMLINFGLEQLRSMAGAWDEVEGAESKLAERFRCVCRSIVSEHGIGYGKTTSGKLLTVACIDAGFDMQLPTARLKYKSALLGTREIDGFLLDGCLLVKVNALQERTTAADMARLMSYMRQLNIIHGALVNFGRSELCIRDVVNNRESHLH